MSDTRTHAELDAEWHKAFDALRAAGLESDADDPIAARYRAAGNAVNHANRRRERIASDPEPIPPSMIVERVEWIESLRLVAQVAADADDHEQADMLNEMADFLTAAPIAYICEAEGCWQVGSEVTKSGERFCRIDFPFPA